MMPATAPRNRTSARLIKAGLHLFGDKGFEGTSTRELAARAGTNIASIAYHFGGKAGLRAACARAVASQIAGALEDAGALDPPATPEEALSRIEQLIGALVRLIVGSPQASDLATFLLRELTHPGEIADMMYVEFLEPRHKSLCALWAAATGRPPEDEEIKLAVFAMIGQVIYFRIAQPFVERRMGWEGVGPVETGKVTAVVTSNLRDTIERLRT